MKNQHDSWQESQVFTINTIWHRLLDIDEGVHVSKNCSQFWNGFANFNTITDFLLSTVRASMKKK